MIRTLIIFVHPALEKSTANRALLEGVSSIDGVTVHDLYEMYPGFNIDVAKEKALLEAHDRIIWQFPFYWYSSTALLKEWFDVVLQYGWAFGLGGKALEGKTARVVTTTGSGGDTYCVDGRNCYSIDEFLRPIEMTAALCRMGYESSLAFHEVLNWQGSELFNAVSTYRNWLMRG